MQCVCHCVYPYFLRYPTCGEMLHYDIGLSMSIGCQFLNSTVILEMYLKSYGIKN